MPFLSNMLFFFADYILLLWSYRGDTWSNYRRLCDDLPKRGESTLFEYSLAVLVSFCLVLWLFCGFILSEDTSGILAKAKKMAAQFICLVSCCTWSLNLLACYQCLYCVILLEMSVRPMWCSPFYFDTTRQDYGWWGILYCDELVCFPNINRTTCKSLFQQPRTKVSCHWCCVSCVSPVST
jgi:hypothetical protein